MFQNIKVKGFLINMSKLDITNDKTGEVTELTKIEYAVQAPTTEFFKGGAIMTAYSKGEAYNMLDKYLFNTVTLEIEQRPTNNGTKFYILAVNDNKLK